MAKVYISGQISGLPQEAVKAKFDKAAERLCKLGYDVVSPLDNGLPSNAPWELHVAMDLILLMGCSVIYLLPDWHKSRGATLEKNYAELTKKEIIYEEIPAFTEIKEAITEVMGVHFSGILSRNRGNRFVYARMIFARLCRDSGATIERIGREMQHHHSTVCYYLAKYEDDYRFTPEFASYAKAVKEKLGIE